MKKIVQFAHSVRGACMQARTYSSKRRVLNLAGAPTFYQHQQQEGIVRDPQPDTTTIAPTLARLHTLHDTKVQKKRAPPENFRPNMKVYLVHIISPCGNQKYNRTTR